MARTTHCLFEVLCGQPKSADAQRVLDRDYFCAPLDSDDTECGSLLKGLAQFAFLLVLSGFVHGFVSVPLGFYDRIQDDDLRHTAEAFGVIGGAVGIGLLFFAMYEVVKGTQYACAQRHGVENGTAPLVVHGQTGAVP